MRQWETPESLRALLCELVSWDSRTLTEGEVDFPLKVYEKMKGIPYFASHPDLLKLGAADYGRQFLTALYKSETAVKTIVLISHFDTVSTEEYGELEALAFNPESLTKELEHYIDELHPEARHDLRSRQYLWGRGTMDMKAGLAIHMGIMEKAAEEKWPINLVLLTVPDEEVNSSGMRSAVRTLNDMKEEHHLDYSLFLNGEPVFSMKPTDTSYHVYSGTIGKIMPSTLFYGRETHVGEPLSGMTSSFMASFLTRKMEWNPLFRETVYGENTPLPITLQQEDLRLNYSAQTPYGTVALYNVFTMKRTAADVMDLFEEVALSAAEECNEWYRGLCEREKIPSVGEVNVLRYSELIDYAEKKLGKNYIEALKHDIGINQGDDREKSFRIADTLLINCQELTPAIVLMFTPPFYPAVNTSDHPLVSRCIQKVTEVAKAQFNLPVEQAHYFNGISDLSYVNYKDENKGWAVFEENTPVWNTTYTIPFKDMNKLEGPVLNVGPFGKDAHKRTERLHIESAFIKTPVFVEAVVKEVMAWDGGTGTVSQE
ncbi:M20/M25/M40 family metallo-hydrolase [Bacillus sp. RO3]|nr:M20/M25/M40 family metallo-hydrolase [Bacillus sp. RO3]